MQTGSTTRIKAARLLSIGHRVMICVDLLLRTKSGGGGGGGDDEEEEEDE